MEWEEIAHKKNITGSGVEIRENGFIYRGPLKAVHKMQDYIILVSSWTIMRRKENILWRNSPITYFVINADNKPKENEKGELRFKQEAINRSGTIFPLNEEEIKNWKKHALALFK